MMEAGINLHSLRTLIKTEEGLIGTVERLRDMGYSFVQFSGAPFDPEMISRMISHTGMPVVLTHVPMDRIINDVDTLMEEHAKFGCKKIGLGYIPPEILADECKAKEIIEKLNLSAEKMNKNGYSFFYHNHQFEFYKHGGQRIIDYMAENAPYFNFTFDTYWAQYGGVSVIDFIEKLQGRISCVHLKDYIVAEPLEKDKDFAILPRFAPVGDGNMDFGKIIPKMQECGTEYFIVEQDNAIFFDDPFAQVERSINYLKKEI